ncbi:MAG: hypothetical protein ACOX8I_08320 [Bacillota bacterium]|jgi:hypothetical protein
MKDHHTSIVVRCLFQLGTPLQPFAVVENTNTDRIMLVRISEEVFTSLMEAGIPICQPTTAPPASLANVNVLCVFRMFIGAQEPIPYAIGESKENCEIVIIQITDALFDFFRLLGVPMCPIIQAINGAD